MGLIQKTLLAIVAIFLCLSAFILASTQLIIINSFHSLEENEITRDLQRVQDAIQNSLTQMTSMAGDWANWDDTYEFVINPSDAYIEENARK